MSGEVHTFEIYYLCSWETEPRIEDLAIEIADIISYDSVGCTVSSLPSRVGLYVADEKDDGKEYIEVDKKDFLYDGSHYYAFVKDHPKFQEVFLLFEDGIITLKSETGQILERYGKNVERLSFQPDRGLILSVKLPEEAHEEMRRQLIEHKNEYKYINNEYDIFWRFYEEFIRLKTEDIKILSDMSL